MPSILKGTSVRGRLRRPSDGYDADQGTFLPYADFEKSVRALDVKRLGKQRVEVIQVVRALTRPGYGWANHPAVLMWKGHEEALGRYGVTCCEVRAGFRRHLCRHHPRRPAAGRSDLHPDPAGAGGGRRLASMAG